MDGAMTKAPLGGESTGRNPTDRGEQGTKRSLLVEGRGVPIGLTVDGANRHDMKLAARLLHRHLQAAARAGAPRAATPACQAGPPLHPLRAAVHGQSNGRAFLLGGLPPVGLSPSLSRFACEEIAKRNSSCISITATCLTVIGHQAGQLLSGRLVTELGTSRQRIEDLAREHGRHSAELERAAATIVSHGRAGDRHHDRDAGVAAAALTDTARRGCQSGVGPSSLDAPSGDHYPAHRPAAEVSRRPGCSGMSPCWVASTMASRRLAAPSLFSAKLT
jgi:hypothetical protein